MRRNFEIKHVRNPKRTAEQLPANVLGGFHKKGMKVVWRIFSRKKSWCKIRRIWNLIRVYIYIHHLWFWILLNIFGWFWMGGFGWFRVVSGSFGWFRVVSGDFGWFHVLVRTLEKTLRFIFWTGAQILIFDSSDKHSSPKISYRAFPILLQIKRHIPQGLVPLMYTFCKVDRDREYFIRSMLRMSHIISPVAQRCSVQFFERDACRNINILCIMSMYTRSIWNWAFCVCLFSNSSTT